MEVYLPESIDALSVDASGDGRVLVQISLANPGVIGFAPTIRLVSSLRLRQEQLEVNGVEIAGDLAGRGCTLATIEPAGGARISARFRVEVEEELQPLSLQAVVSTSEGSVGSNVAQCLVRAAALVRAQHTWTYVGNQPVCRVLVENGGLAAARDLGVRVRRPVGCDYVEGDGVHHVATLAPGETCTFTNAFTIVDGAPASLTLPPVDVWSRATDPLRLAELTLAPGSPAIRLEATAEYRGSLIEVHAIVTNAGRSTNRETTVRFTYPDALRRAPASSLVDGTAVDGMSADDVDEIALGDLEPGETRRVSIAFYAERHAAGDFPISIDARADQATAVAHVVARIQRAPSLDRSTLCVERDSIAVGDRVRMRCRVRNSGDADAYAIEIVLASQAIRNCTGFIRTGQGSWSREVAMVPAGVTHEVFTDVELDAAESTTTDVQMEIGSREVPMQVVDRRTIAIVADPRLEGIIDLVVGGPLRLEESRELVLVLANSGRGVARDVAVRMTVPNGMTANPEVLTIGDLAPDATTEVRCSIRSQRPVRDDVRVAIGATLSAANHYDRELTPLVSVVASDVGIVAELVTSVDEGHAAWVGDVVEVSLRLENTGSGAARRVDAGLEPLPHAEVVDTMINGSRATSATLHLIEPGAVATIGWRLRILAAAASRYVSPTARVAWGAGQAIVVSGQPFLARTRTIIAAGNGGAGHVLAPMMPLQAPIEPAVAKVEATSSSLARFRPVEDRLREAGLPASGDGARTPPETISAPIPDGENGALSQPIAASELPAVIEAPVEGEPQLEEAVLEYDLSPAVVERVERVLRACGGRGVVTHLIALSRLLPARLATSDAAAAEAYDAVVRETRRTADRLFIVSNLAGYKLTSDDVEPPAMRHAIDSFVAVVAGNGSTVDESAGLFTTIPLSGLRELTVLLDTAPAGSVLVWLLLVGCLATRGVSPLAQHLGEYRDSFERVLAATYDTVADLVAAKLDTADLDELLGRVIEALPQAALA